MAFEDKVDIVEIVNASAIIKFNYWPNRVHMCFVRHGDKKKKRRKENG